MVWKKKNKFKQFKNKIKVYSFGFKSKDILNRFFFFWKKRFLWNLEDSKKFFKKFLKNSINTNFFFYVFDLSIKNFFIYKKLNFINRFKNSFLKKWIFSLLKVLIRNGYKKKSISILIFVLWNLKKKILNLKNFFLKIKKNMHLPLKLRLRIVAGKKLYIPVILLREKEIMHILRLILSCLKLRSEKNFKIKLLNELLDVYYNKGLSIKKKIQLNKDIKENIPNIRYLNF